MFKGKTHTFTIFHERKRKSPCPSGHPFNQFRNRHTFHCVTRISLMPLLHEVMPREHRGFFRNQWTAGRVVAGISVDCREIFEGLGLLTLPSMFILGNLLKLEDPTEQYSRHERKHTYNTRNKNNFIPSSLRLERCRTGPSALVIEI